MNAAGRGTALLLLPLLSFALPAPAAGRGDGGDGGIVPGTSRQIVLDERAGPFRRSFRLHLPAG